MITGIVTCEPFRACTVSRCSSTGQGAVCPHAVATDPAMQMASRRRLAERQRGDSLGWWRNMANSPRLERGTTQVELLTQHGPVESFDKTSCVCFDQRSE